MGIPVSPPTTLTPPAGDRANAVLSGSFAATGQSLPWQCVGAFNLIFGGASGPNGAWAATIRVERSYNGGSSWYVCGIGGAGIQAIYNTGTDVSLTISDPEEGMLYRLNCTAYTSGTVNYRFSTSGTAATSFGIV